MPLVGSSRMTSSGRLISEAATPSRCIMPTEKPRTLRSAASVRPTFCSQWGTSVAAPMPCSSASHQLLEVQRVCDRVAILNKGRLVREGAVSELTAVGERLRLAVTPVAQVLEVLGSKGVAEGDAVLADIPRAEGPALIRALAAAGVDIHEARWVGTDLEAIFFTETGAVQTPETIHAG